MMWRSSCCWIELLSCLHYLGFSLLEKYIRFCCWKQIDALMMRHTPQHSWTLAFACPKRRQRKSSLRYQERKKQSQTQQVIGQPLESMHFDDLQMDWSLFRRSMTREREAWTVRIRLLLWMKEESLKNGFSYWTIWNNRFFFRFLSNSFISSANSANYLIAIEWISTWFKPSRETTLSSSLMLLWEVFLLVE